MPDREPYDADEDPLVELARIVSEDAGFSGRLTARPKAEPPPVAEREAVSSDLEAELLQELESSFAVREPAQDPAEPSLAEERFRLDEPAEPDEPVYASAPASPRPSGRQEPPPAEEDPEDLLRSIEQQLSQFEQRVRGGRLADEDEAPVADEEADAFGLDDALAPADDRLDAPQTATPRSEYRFRGPAAVDWDSADAPAGRAAEQPLEPPTSVADVGAAADLFGRSPLGPDEPDADYVDEQQQAGRFAAEHRGAPSSYPQDELANARGYDLAGLEAELSRELEPAYGERSADGWQEADAESADREHAAAAAMVAPEHGMQAPPRPAAPAAARRSRKGLAMAAAVFIVVLLGGAGAMYLRWSEQGSGEPPPVIAAPEGPVKIQSAEAQGDDGGGQTVGEAVYDRVAGNAPDTQENVVDGAEEPREIARIVLPSEGEGAGETMAMEQSSTTPGERQIAESAGQMQPGEAQGSSDDFGPRRVETFVVRPDGSIVATAEAGGGAEADLSAENLATTQTAAMEPKPVQTVTIDEPRTVGRPTATGDASSAAGEANAPPAALAEQEPMEPLPEADVTEGEELAATEAPEEPAPAVSAPAEAPVEEPEVALAPEPEAAPPPPTAASGYVVQISAQASQEAAEATFASLQRRYPSILGDLEANIQRADLGERGIYYRVRVGPWADRADAIQVCEALQAAGGDCYVP